MKGLFRNERTIGAFGSLLNGLNVPVDVAVGSDGRLFVVNRGHSVMNGSSGGPSLDINAAVQMRVKVWAMDDENLKEFGLAGSGDGQLLWPTAVAADVHDRIYVSDEGRHDVQVFDAQGAFLERWGSFGTRPGEFNRPAGLAILPGGNVLVSDCLNHRIQTVSPHGEPLAAWGSLGVGPGQLDQPWGLAVDDRGDVYVADWGNHRVQKFSQDGRYLASFGSTGSEVGQLRRPSGVAVDHEGNVYVADLGNNRVQVFGAKGTPLVTLLGDGSLSKWAVRYYQIRPAVCWQERADTDVDRERPFRGPTAVKIDRQGRLLVVDSVACRIQVYERIEGSTDGAEDPMRRGQVATEWLVKEYLPGWLERAGLTDMATRLREVHEVGTAEQAASVLPLVAAARDAAWDAAVLARADARRRSAWDAARADAWPAARVATWESIALAARDAAGAAAWAAEEDVHGQHAGGT